MKVKIKKFNGELPSYLSYCKEYVVISGNYPYLDILGDNGEDIFIDINDCSHLNGGSWEFCCENNDRSTGARV